MSRRDFGYGRLDRLGRSIARLCLDAPFLLVRGSRSFDDNGLATYFATEFAPDDYRVYTVSSPLPSLDEYSRFVRQHGGVHFGCVVATGGGHVIDTAKLIALDRDCEELRGAIVQGRAIDRRLPLLVVPTTMGTGSEETSFAVVYVDGRKFSVEHPSLRPDHAIIDPALCFTLSDRQLAVSGLDAVTQAIESLLSRRSDETSASHARRALRLGWRALPRLIQSRTRRDFLRMSLAANLAGRAINITRTTIPHALSYYVTERYGVPHGHAVALSMGRYLGLFGRRLGQPCGALQKWRRDYDFVLRVLGCRHPNDVTQRWSEYLIGLGLPAFLDGIGIDRRDLADLWTNVDPKRFANAPIEISDRECLSLFDFAPASDDRSAFHVTRA